MPTTILNSKLLAAAMRTGRIDVDGNAIPTGNAPGECVLRDASQAGTLTFLGENIAKDIGKKVSQKEDGEGVATTPEYYEIEYTDETLDANIEKLRNFLESKKFTKDEITAILQYSQLLDLSQSFTNLLSELGFIVITSNVKKDFYKHNNVAYFETIIKLEKIKSPETGEEFHIPGNLICKYKLVDGKYKLIKLEPTTDLLRSLMEKNPQVLMKLQQELLKLDEVKKQKLLEFEKDRTQELLKPDNQVKRFALLKLYKEKKVALLESYQAKKQELEKPYEIEKQKLQKDIMQLISKEQISKAWIQNDQYEAIDNLLLKFESKIAAKRMDPKFAELCEQVDVIKNQIEQLRGDPQVDRSILIKALELVNCVAVDPTKDNIKALKTFAEDKVCKRSWGKIFGGVLLTFVSAAAAVVSAGAALLIAPIAAIGIGFSIGGVVVGADLVKEGIKTREAKLANSLKRFGMFASNQVPEAGRAAHVEDSTVSKRSSVESYPETETESEGTVTPPSSIDSEDESESVVFDEPENVAFKI